MRDRAGLVVCDTQTIYRKLISYDKKKDKEKNTHHAIGLPHTSARTNHAQRPECVCGLPSLTEPPNSEPLSKASFHVKVRHSCRKTERLDI